MSLRRTAEDLSQAFDDPKAATGAKEMLASLERALELLGFREERTRL